MTGRSDDPTAADRAGVVLAGGHSRRFGDRDKALAELAGDPLVRRVVDRLSPVVDEVVVSCRPEQVDQLEGVLPSTPLVRTVADRYPGAGPLAGVDAGLDAVAGQYVAVIACDMPFVEPATIETLFRRATDTDADAAVPSDADGNLQPVQAVYRRAAMGTVAAEMLPEGGSLHAALDALSVEPVTIEDISKRSLHNVNTRADLVAAERQYCETE